MQDQGWSAKPAPGPLSLPQPPSPRQECKSPWLPCMADLKRLWAPGLVLCALTRTYNAPGALYETFNTCLYVSTEVPAHNALLDASAVRYCCFLIGMI